MAHVERNPDGIMAWLRAEAATGRALRAADLQCERWNTSAVAKALHYLQSTVHLHRAKLAFKQVFYLATPEAADAYVKQHQAAYLNAKLQAALAREAALPPKRRHGKARAIGAPAHARPVQAAEVPACVAAPEAEARPLPPITYCPSAASGPMVGHCPADRKLVLRAGSMDYRRHMTKFDGHAT